VRAFCPGKSTNARQPRAASSRTSTRTSIGVLQLHVSGEGIDPDTPRGDENSFAQSSLPQRGVAAPPGPAEWPRGRTSPSSAAAGFVRGAAPAGRSGLRPATRLAASPAAGGPGLGLRARLVSFEKRILNIWSIKRSFFCRTSLRMDVIFHDKSNNGYNDATLIIFLHAVKDLIRFVKISSS